MISFARRHIVLGPEENFYQNVRLAQNLQAVEKGPLTADHTNSEDRGNVRLFTERIYITH